MKNLDVLVTLFIFIIVAFPETSGRYFGAAIGNFMMAYNAAYAAHR